MPSTTSKPKLKYSWQFEAIGTQWLIETEKPLGELKNIITARIDSYDKTYSRFREDSLVGKIASKKGEYHFPADAEKLVDFYNYLYDLTDGAVSPLVGNVLVAAGYDREYSLRPGTVTAAPKWDETMKWNGSQVMMKRPAVLDFGAAGKGYLVDLLGEILERHGFDSYVIDASGDIRIRGIEQTVGLENPHDPTRVIGAVQLNDMSLCASATNRRTWGEWHHVIDPRTAEPVNKVVATWVIAPTTIEADGLTTALFFVPGERIGKNKHYVRLMSDGTIEHSPDFMGQLFV